MGWVAEKEGKEKRKDCLTGGVAEKGGKEKRKVVIEGGKQERKKMGKLKFKKKECLLSAWDSCIFLLS